MAGKPHPQPWHATVAAALAHGATPSEAARLTVAAHPGVSFTTARFHATRRRQSTEPRMAQKHRGSARSLTQFVRDQKRKGCPVCALPPDVLSEVRSAREKRISRQTVIEWLKVEHGIAIPSAAFDTHVNARHDVGVDDAA